MKKMLSFMLFLSITLFVVAGCSQAAPEPAADTSMDTMENMEEVAEDVGMEHDMAEEGMDQDMAEEDMEHDMEEMVTEHGMEAHQPMHGGQVGMAMHAAKDGTDFHLEIVSEAPGEYQVYLTDNNREPVSPEGYEGTVALIRPDGSEIASMPLESMGDHLMAQGGPTEDAEQLDVRVTVEGPDLADMLEMEFTLLY